MLQEVIHPVIHPPEQLPIDNVTSPISAQMFDFCDQDLFPEPLQNSDVSSCSNCIYEDNSSYTTTTNISYSSSFPSDVGKFSSNSSSNSNNNNSNNENDINLSTMTNNNNLSIIFDSQDETDNNIAASINFLSQTTFCLPQFISNQEDQFDFSSLQSQIPLTDVKIPLSDIKIPLTDVVNNVNGFSPYSPDQVAPLAPVAPLVPNVFDEDCLSALPASYVNLDPSSPSCSFLDPSVAPFFPGTLNSGLPGDATGIFTGGILMAGSELQPHELDFQGDNGGIYGSDSVQRVYNSSEIQTITDNQQLVNGGGSSNSPLTSEISTLEESSYKVGRLSVEERKEKIHRYMKKRNERNFSKKIKYACRKTLADSRPRVRGRFAKNDDFGEAVRSNGIHHDDEDDELQVVGKEEEDMVDSSDIFAHISGVNSFKCNYPLQSWM